MLIDEEPNPPSEIEAVEETKAPELPEKYRSKTLEEVIRMHQEAEKLIGKQAQEVGEVRKLAELTTRSTQQISDIVGGVRQANDAAFQSITRAKEQALAGASQTEEIRTAVAQMQSRVSCSGTK